MLLCAGSSRAQDDIPPAADVGRQGSAQEKGVLPELQAPQAELKSRTPALDEKTAKTVFLFKSLTLHGATILDQAQRDAFTAAYVGREITVADLFGILNAIQQYYLDRGFSLTRVVMPEQSLDDGEIDFDVIEGYVAAVEIDPEIGPDPMIEDFRTRILNQRPLDLKNLERLMLVLNDRPGHNLSAILATMPEGQEAPPGAVRLLLRQNEKQKRVSASLSVDDYGSTYTGSGQISGGISLNDTGFRWSDLSLSGRMTTSHQELQQISANYTLPLWEVSGLNAVFSGNRTRTRPGAELGALDLAGRSTILKAGVEYPLVRQRDENLIVGMNFQTKDSETRILRDRIFYDRIRSISASLQYGAIDRLAAQNSASIVFSRGINILNASKSGSDMLSRSAGHSDFSLWKADYARLQPLYGPWLFSISLRGQYSDKPLLSSEEFGFGGADLGRGYDPSEIAGDRGAAASLEILYDRDVRYLNRHIDLQPFAFYDIGKIWNTDSGTKNRISAASAGFGLRVSLENDIFMKFMLAKPLTLSASKPPKYSDPNGVRVLFSLTRRF